MITTLVSINMYINDTIYTFEDGSKKKFLHAPKPGFGEHGKTEFRVYPIKIKKQSPSYPSSATGGYTSSSGNIQQSNSGGGFQQNYGTSQTNQSHPESETSLNKELLDMDNKEAFLNVVNYDILPIDKIPFFV
jgi:hypothetical protein